MFANIICLLLITSPPFYTVEQIKTAVVFFNHTFGSPAFYSPNLKARSNYGNRTVAFRPSITRGLALSNYIYLKHKIIKMQSGKPLFSSSKTLIFYYCKTAPSLVAKGLPYQERKDTQDGYVGPVD
jgi:hypothetical protein